MMIMYLQASPDVVLSTAVTSLKVEDASDPNRVTCVVHNRGYAIYFSRGIIPFNKLREGGELLDRILSSTLILNCKSYKENERVEQGTTVSECNKKPNVLSVYKVKVKVLFSFKLDGEVELGKKQGLVRTSDEKVSQVTTAPVVRDLEALPVKCYGPDFGSKTLKRK
ncbi:3-deoxy-manno-octulosonate cytidylyltransferase, mitochondrial [Tanacetum coccineum]|uniref:3-deoxy-manno-octulosonate cytidylyltransferase, mitochondrial n=1 Tax=Tanacetum coccineum TaxID=301880 RepID=A0ABQ5IWQ5_9ASTR